MYNKIPIVILKSNSYGLGVRNIVPILEQTDCTTVCVNNILEAMEVRALTSKFTIMLLENKELPNLQTLRDYNIIPIINSINDLLDLADKRISCTLNIDVGMNRTGLKLSDIQDNIHHIKAMKDYIVHIMGHLHITSQTPMSPINQREKEVFDQSCRLIEHIIDKKVPISLCSSNALEFGPEYIYSYPRIGKAIYGIIHKNYGLEESISIREKISFVKKAEPGEIVGYNGHKIFNESYLGIISVGYTHGMSLSFQEQMEVKYKNNFYKIISISMEYTIIDFQSLKPEVGEEVILFPRGFVQECNKQQVYYLEQLIRFANMQKVLME